MKIKMKYFVIVIAVLCFSAQAEKIAIVNALAHTIKSGIIDDATLLIDDGIIQSVAKNGKVPKGYRVIDAADKPVTPGFMNAFTSLGLYENTLSGSPEDDQAENAAYSAALDISWAFNPASTLLPITRIEGVTHAAVSAAPTRSIFAGQGALFHLGNSNHLIKAKAFQLVDMGEVGANLAGGSRAAAWTNLYNALEETQSFKSKESWQGGHAQPLLTHLDIQALQSVINKKHPLLIRASRLSDIKNVLQLKAETGLNIILLGGEEAWMAASQLAAADIPVIIDPSVNLPTAFQSLASTKTNAAKLHKAGVLIAFTTWFGTSGDHNARLLPQFAGQAVAHGLPYQAALQALTLNPAKIWGVDKQYGALVKGMEATIVIWDGDPLEVTSAPANVLIQGEDIKLESRQTLLRDKYLKQVIPLK